MNHIELFSGCGGMALGLRACGFNLLLANELSPMAATTFAYNFLSENLAVLAKDQRKPKHVIWLSSKFRDLAERLRENPFEYPTLGTRNSFSDLPHDPKNLAGKLIVGSINDLNRYLRSNPEAQMAMASAFGAASGLDLVSGGPPCQSFSMAGLRRKDCEKNTLPWEFSEFVGLAKPKLVVLENVSGILRAFKGADDKSFYAWYEVSKSIAEKGYIPLCLHINARHAGVPQNRPRFILIGIRYDHFLQHIYKKPLCDPTGQLLTPSVRFMHRVKRYGVNLPLGYLTVFDSALSEHRELMMNSFLKHLFVGDEVSVKDAIDDLRRTCPRERSQFVEKLHVDLEMEPRSGTVPNNKERRHSDLVRQRFRVYQILRDIENKEIRDEVEAILRVKRATLSREAWDLLRNVSFFVSGKKFVRLPTRKALSDYLRNLSTLKRSQRALDPHEPAPATLSIPDDSCHYEELRVLTVREMARIQSFPDSFVFLSKETTGGSQRRYEVPQYTQVGNAVPPLLAKRLGMCLVELLD